MSLVVTLLSPFFGLVFIISVAGNYLAKSNKEGMSSLYFLIMTGAFMFLAAIGTLAKLDVIEIIIGVVFSAWLYVTIVRKSGDYTEAFYFSSLMQICYAFVRTILFKGAIQKQIDLLFTSYHETLKNKSSFASFASNEQFAIAFDQIKKYINNYQTAIWALTMVLALYIGTYLLARKNKTPWSHSKLRLPYWSVYLLIVGLSLSVIPTTKLMGYNSILIMMGLFLIQGLAVIDFWSKKFLKRNRFIMVATVFLMFVNAFFAITVALVGVSDYWFDVRGLNQT